MIKPEDEQKANEEVGVKGKSSDDGGGNDELIGRRS